MGHFIRTVLFIFGIFGQSVVFGQKSELSAGDIRAFMEAEGKYETLIQRVADGDPTLTLDDYALAYYGFSYTEGYSPYSTEDLYMSLPSSLLDEDDLQEHISICHEYLDRVPVNIGALGILHDLSRWFDENGLPDDIYVDRMKALERVVKASGEGTYDSPLRIVFFKDALSVISPDYFEVADYKVKDGRLFLSVSFPAVGGNKGADRDYVFSLDLCNPDVPEITEFFLAAEGNTD